MALTRVTVTAEHRSVELLLPGDEPLASLMPRINDLTGFSGTVPDGARTVLNHVGGPALSPRMSLQDQHVDDGDWLLLTLVEDALPEPIVYDIADSGEELLPLLRRWSDRHVHVAAAVASGALGLLCAVAFLALMHPDLALPAALGIAGLSCVALAWRPWSRHDLAPALTPVPLAALALVFTLVPHPPLTVTLICGAVFVMTLGAIGISVRMPRSSLSLLTAAGVLAGTWSLSWWLAPAPQLAALVAGSVSLVVLGVMPRVAIALSGLDTMDRHTHGDRTDRRSNVLRVLTSVHRSLTGSILIVTVSLLFAAGLLISTTRPSAWILAALGLWTTVIALRGRHFPLLSHRMLLGFCAVLLFGATLWSTAHADIAPWLPVAALVVLASVAFGLLAAPWFAPAPHVVSRLRLLGNRVEFIAALAVVPIVVGAFDLYTLLLETF